MMIKTKPCVPTLKKSCRSRTQRLIFLLFNQQPITAKAVAGVQLKPKTSANHSNFLNSLQLSTSIPIVLEFNISCHAITSFMDTARFKRLAVLLARSSALQPDFKTRCQSPIRQRRQYRRREGIKLTHQRIEILREVAQTGGASRY